MKGGEIMKEAAGEANMTVITIVLIGVVAAVGALIIPRVMDGLAKKSACSEMGGQLTGNTCNYKDFSSSVNGVNASCTLNKCTSGSAKGTYVCGSTTTCPS